VFEPGRVYRRSELHHEWGGMTRLQQQGGILTPREVPLVIVVTGEEGHPFGYDDHWDDDGIFQYFGAGQEGPMQWLRGNVALRDHAENGEDVHLFEQIASGLRYVGQFVCAGYEERGNVPDRNGDLRTAFVFDLVALDAQLSALPAEEVESSIPAGVSSAGSSSWSIPLSELRAKLAPGVAVSQPDAKEAKRKVYQRSTELKVYVLRRANGACEGCQAAAPFLTKAGRPYLEPHHVRRLSDGGPDDYHHVIALCPTCHRRVHHAEDGEAFNSELVARLETLES
jgi:5-methylcytosine-specific restriction protein A